MSFFLRGGFSNFIFFRVTDIFFFFFFLGASSFEGGVFVSGRFESNFVSFFLGGEFRIFNSF